MIITDAMGRRLIGLVRNVLRRYHHHPQWDDIVSFGLLRACESLTRAPEQDPEAVLGLAARAAEWSVQGFFQGQHCDLTFRRTTSRGTPLPRQLSLDTGPDDPDAPGEWWKGVEPDFAPALIEALDMERLAAQSWEAMTAPEQEIVWRWLAGESRGEIGRSLGYSKTWVNVQCQRGLNRVRRQEGQPEQWSGRHAPDYNERRRAQRAARRRSA